MIKIISATLFFSLFLAMNASTAEAATRFGVVCVTNRANANIRYLFKVGDGGWDSRFMGPGQARVFYHRYDFAGENRAPKFFIRYDGDLHGQNKFTHTEHLARVAAAGNSCAEGSQYEFQHEPANRNFIKLIRVR